MKKFFNTIVSKTLQLYQSTDLVFLIFLLLFLNIKLPVKLAGLVFIYACRFNFSFKVSFKKNTRLPLFYLLMLLLCVIELVVNGVFQKSYLILFTSCASIWAICFLVMHQVKLAIERNGVVKVENALRIFLVVNAIASFLNLLSIVFETGTLNPYTYEGLSYKYFTSTGDYIRGIMFDLCTTNMIINALALFYFLYKERFVMATLCLLVVLLTTSNLGNIILIVFLIFLFFAKRSRFYKTIVLSYLAILLIFMVKVSPANLDYFLGSFRKMETGSAHTVAAAQANTPHVLNKDSLIRIYISKKKLPNVKEQISPAELEKIVAINEIQSKIQHERPAMQVTDTVFAKSGNSSHVKMMDFCKATYGDSLKTETIARVNGKKMPGKLVSFVETLEFLSENPKAFLFGAGPGNFSSKFAFRALGLNTDGAWIKGQGYMSPSFRDNHLKIWTSYQVQPPAEHSVMNFPNSTFNQVAGEYGITGVLLFVFFYIFYFLKHFRSLSYGKLILPMLLAFTFTDYWFEGLSIFIIFETLIFLDLHKDQQIPE